MVKMASAFKRVWGSFNPPIARTTDQAQTKPGPCHNIANAVAETGAFLPPHLPCRPCSLSLCPPSLSLVSVSVSLVLSLLPSHCDTGLISVATATSTHVAMAMSVVVSIICQGLCLCPKLSSSAFTSISTSMSIFTELGYHRLLCHFNAGITITTSISLSRSTQSSRHKEINFWLQRLFCPFRGGRLAHIGVSVVLGSAGLCAV